MNLHALGVEGVLCAWIRPSAVPILEVKQLSPAAYTAGAEVDEGRTHAAAMDGIEGGTWMVSGRARGETKRTALAALVTQEGAWSDGYLTRSSSCLPGLQSAKEPKPLARRCVLCSRGARMQSWRTWRGC